MEYLSIKELAELVGVHPNTVHNWINAGKLRAYKVGKLIRIKKEDFEDFIQVTDVKEGK